MEWIYNNVNIDYWYNLTLDEQLVYLEKYYPIGYEFYLTDDCPASGNIGYKNKSNVIIDEYVIEISYLFNNIKKEWYCLKIKNSYSHSGLSIIHPNFLKPSKQTEREIKLKEILK